jgi:hypothetical protein
VEKRSEDRDVNRDERQGAKHKKVPTRLGLIAGFVGGFLLVVLVLFLWFAVNFGRSGW